MLETRIKYIGTEKDVMMFGVGVINPGDEFDVDETLGKQLEGRPQFVKVKEPKKKRKRPPLPPIRVEALTEPQPEEVTPPETTPPEPTNGGGE